MRSLQNPKMFTFQVFGMMHLTRGLKNPKTKGSQKLQPKGMTCGKSGKDNRNLIKATKSPKKLKLKKIYVTLTVQFWVK